MFLSPKRHTDSILLAFRLRMFYANRTIYLYFHFIARMYDRKDAKVCYGEFGGLSILI